MAIAVVSVGAASQAVAARTDSSRRNRHVAWALLRGRAGSWRRRDLALIVSNGQGG